MTASGVIEHVSQDLCDFPRDSFTDDFPRDSYTDEILSLLYATKHRIESLNVDQICEQPSSAKVVNQNALLIDLEKSPTTEEVTGEEEERDNVEEDAVKGEDQKEKDEEEGLVKIASPTMPREENQGEGDGTLVFIKCEDSSSIESEIKFCVEKVERPMDGEDRTLQDLKKRSKQEEREGWQKDKDLLTLTIKNEVSYSCGGCDFKFFDRDGLKEHIENMHLNEDVRMIGIGCKSCEDGELHQNCDFDKKTTLDQKLGDFKDPPQLSCDACDYKSSKRRKMQDHILAVHLRTVRYSCNLCNYKSFYFDNVKKHQKTHRNENAKWLPIKCNQCQTQVVHNKSELCLSESTRSVIIPEYACTNCDYKTFKKRYLKAHNCENTTAKYFLMLKQKKLHIANNCPPQEDVLNCNHCEYETKIRHNLKRHRKLAHQENEKTVHSCPKCDYKSSKKIYMEKHIKLNHSESCISKEDIIHCRHCENETKTALSMKSHNQLVHKKTESGFRSCSKCEYKTSKSTYMYKHIQLNHSENSVLQEAILHCKDCEYETKRFQGMKTHTDMVHKKLVKFGCNKCSVKSLLVGVMRRHIKRSHKVSNAKVISYDCKLCVNNTNHLKCETQPPQKTSEEDSSIKKKCPSCDFFSENRKNMNSHKGVMHKKIKNFSCNMCDYKYFKRYSIRRHMSLKHKEGEAVKKRTKKKRTKQNYKQHKHDSTPLNQHCNFCKFSSNKTGLRDHMISSHPLEKLFECDQCDYKCNWQSNLDMHKRSKHEKVSLFCNDCEYTSTWKVALLYHKRLKHGIFQKNTKYKELLEFQESICENCGFAGTSKMSMKLHSKSGCDLWV